MSANASGTPPSVKTRAQDGESATHCPAKTTNKIRATPISEPSSTRPGRTKRKYIPISSAMGIVIANVNVAHGDDFSAFTTTRAITPSKITMMAKTASWAMNPPRWLTSSRAICPSDLPSRPRNGRKMVSKQNPLVRRDKVAAVVVALRRRCASIVQRKQPGRHECGIKPESDQVAAHCGNHEPHRVQRLAAL